MIGRAGRLLIFAAVFCGGHQAHAYETYKVVGIAAGDSLVIREQPDESRKVSDWKEQGRIPSGAGDVLGTGRSMLVGEQRWMEVAFKTARGWVNAKFSRRR